MGAPLAQLLRSPWHNPGTALAQPLHSRCHWRWAGLPPWQGAGRHRPVLSLQACLRQLFALPPLALPPLQAGAYSMLRPSPML